MTSVTIEIPDRLEKELRLRAAVGRKELPEVVLELVESSLSLSAPSTTAQADERRAWVERFREWAASQGAHGGKAEWSRESIYEGRGE